MKGKVVRFNHEKGYGFIRPEDGSVDVFVHMKDLRKAGLETVEVGQSFTFEIGNDGPREKAVRLQADDLWFTGRVKTIVDGQSFGFIEPNARGAADVFMHERAVARSGVFVAVGDMVSYTVVMDRGKPAVGRIRKL